MVKLVEIYEKAAEYDSELETNRISYNLREIFVNPSYIVYMSGEERLNNMFKAGHPLGLHEGTSYTQVMLMYPGSSCRNITVVGAPDHIESLCRSQG